MQVKISHQDGNGKIRKVFDNKDLDACRYLGAADTLPVLKDTMNKINESLGYSFKTCPLTEISIRNGSFSYNTTIDSEINVGAIVFPNGLMNAYVRLYNQKDPNILTLSFNIKISVATNRNKLT